MKNSLKRNDGFTLVELIVVVAILSILSVGLLNILASSQRASQSMQEAMTSQQLSETVISTIRANIANVEDLSVMNTPATIPDKAITETKDAYGNILLDADGNKFVDDYCYIYYDPVNGGIVINNYDPATKTRSSASIGEARRLNMSYSAFTEVKFSLWDDTCLDVQADSFLMENANPANKVATSNYSLSTSIATDENVVQLDEYMDPIRIGTYSCIRFRRMNAGKNYQWTDVTNYEINPDGMTQQEVKLGVVDITDSTAGKGHGQVVAYNQKDTPWLWTLNNQALKGKKILSCTSSTMSCAVAADGLSVTFKPKNALGREEALVAYDFEFTFQPDSGEQKVEIVDKNDGTGYIAITNTCAGNYDWTASFGIGGAEITDFKVTNPTAGGGTCINNFPTSSTATSVTVSGSMPHNDAAVGINFTYKVNTGDVTVTVNRDDTTMTGTVTVTNTKKTNENWDTTIDFAKIVDVFNIGEAATEGAVTNVTSIKVKGVILANSTKTYTFTYTYKSTEAPFNVSYTAPASGQRTGDFNGVTGKFTDVYIIIENLNDTEKTQDWECNVSFLNPVQVTDVYGSVDYSNPVRLKGSITLAGGEKTNDSPTGNYIKLTYFEADNGPVNVPVTVSISGAKESWPGGYEAKLSFEVPSAIQNVQMYGRIVVTINATSYEAGKFGRYNEQEFYKTGEHEMTKTVNGTWANDYKLKQECDAWTNELLTDGMVTAVWIPNS